ncbi:MAG: hypothetical protein COY81_02320 [Candidatus Pacebacteria bacterium CG_4_10_14_0_8_um_filter_43_12]|nr:MAG: hypothetical protein COU66_01050 [Candidatus Pacebacteria bacterium CG10_big_fil_rev_8_21_14_0_10_44_11]PIY79482.1 MAG: hypothetical protein COY81_02320 [Candidatus Pacebacteria bacterium CG_4_10_14_0_8_um_filter_43_12]
MLSLLFSIGIFVLVLSFLVLIHELGHFFAAKQVGITVKEFGLGYPPKAYKLFVWQGTEFSLNWIPFGGFVRMDGEEADPTKRNNQTKKGEFYAANLFQRLYVVLAGATVNFLFGILAFTILFSWLGVPTPVDGARIGYIAPDSPAAQAGVPSSVRVIGFQTNQAAEITLTASPDQVIEFVGAHQGQEVVLVTTGDCVNSTCQDAVAYYPVYLRTQAETPQNEGSLGIAFDQIIFTHFPWWQTPWEATRYGVGESLALGGEILKALSKLGTDLVQRGQLSSELAGPVGIVHQAYTLGILNQGFLMILSFAAMLSINLAIMNVLPITPLDGGKAFFTLLELFVARKHLFKMEYWLSYGGYVGLMLLIVAITIRDVIRLF